ncbi:MAG: hypothetical protein QXH91_01685 [Candidatus Bathyarchaeia archaeon]
MNRTRLALVLLYGRRRVGKTSLVQEFMKDKRGLYFYVPNAEEKTILAEFSRVVENEFFKASGSWTLVRLWNILRKGVGMALLWRLTSFRD